MGGEAVDEKNATIYVEDAVQAEIGTGPAASSRKAISEGIAGGKLELLELHQPDAILKVTPDQLGVGKVKTSAGERINVRFQPILPFVRRSRFTTTRAPSACLRRMRTTSTRLSGSTTWQREA